MTFILASIPAGAWSAIAAGTAVLGGGTGVVAKLILAFRQDNKDLQDKVMDKAIPALEANAEATKMMVAATQQILTALAVMQAVRDDERPSPRSAPRPRRAAT